MLIERGKKHPSCFFFKTISGSFENITSELLIQCLVVCCTTYGYYDLLVSYNPEILLLLQRKII